MLKNKQWTGMYAKGSDDSLIWVSIRALLKGTVVDGRESIRQDAWSLGWELTCDLPNTKCYPLEYDFNIRRFKRHYSKYSGCRVELDTRMNMLGD